MTKFDKHDQKSQADEKFKECFDALKMPPEAKEATLSYIKKQASTNIGVVTPLDAIPTQSMGAKQSPATTQSTATARVSGTRQQAAIGVSKKRKSKKLAFAAAACLLLLLSAFGGFRWYSTETAYVNIDLNPSLELGINRFDTVVSARALNAEGQDVLDQVDAVGLSYSEALDAILENEVFLTYIYDDSFIELNVACSSEEQRTILCEVGEFKIGDMPCGGMCTGMDYEVRQEALEKGMGLGKYRESLTLLELDPSLDFDDCKSMSMRQLRDRIAELDPDSEYEYSGKGSMGNRGTRDNSLEEGSDANRGSKVQGEGSGGDGGKPYRRGKNHV